MECLLLAGSDGSEIVSEMGRSISIEMVVCVWIGCCMGSSNLEAIPKRIRVCTKHLL